MKKKFAGYINLKNLNGILFPSSIQNILMKEYIQNKLKSIFYLSPTEVMQAKFSITLKTLLSKETKVSGVVMLSSFYLPNDIEEREELFKIALKNKKEIHFIFDELIFKKKKDIQKIEDFLIFNNEFFTKTKKNLSEEERQIFKNFKVSFV